MTTDRTLAILRGGLSRDLGGRGVGYQEAAARGRKGQEREASKSRTEVENLKGHDRVPRCTIAVRITRGG